MILRILVAAGLMAWMSLPAAAQYLNVYPQALQFTVPVGSTLVSPSSATLTITSTSQTFYSVYSSQQWLVASPYSGITTAVTGGYATAQVNVSINPIYIYSLPAGTYYGTLQVTSTASSVPYSVNVSLVVGGSGTSTGTGALTSTPGSLAFSTGTSGTTPTQTLTITSNTGASVPFTAIATSTGGSWLRVNPSSASATPGGITVSVSVDPDQTSGTGPYNGQISFYGAAQSGLLLSVPVTYSAGGGGGSGPFSVSPSSLTFSSIGGQTPANQTVSIGGGGAFFVTQPYVSWMTVTVDRYTAPATMTVSVNPANMGAGVYQSKITLSTSGTGTAVSQDISVTLNVGGGNAVTVSPTLLEFNYIPGGATPSAQAVTVSTLSTSVYYQVSILQGAGWLNVNQSLGITPGQIVVSVNPAGLGVGNNAGVIMISLNDGSSPQYVAVNLLVGSSPSITVSPTTLSFNTTSTLYYTNSQTVTVNSTSGSAIAFTPSVANGNWIQIPSSTNSAPGSFTVQVNSSFLNPGTYTGVVLVTPVTGGSRAVSVTLVVGGQSNVVVSPNALNFTWSGGTALPAAQTFSLYAPTGTFNTLTATTSSGGSWLSVSPTYVYGSSSATDVQVYVDPRNITQSGTYQGQITVNSSGLTSASATVYVNLTVNVASATLVLSPTSLAFTHQIGAGAPASQALSISTITSTSGTATSGLAYTATTSSSWLNLSGATGTTPGNMTVSINTAGLGVGTQNGQISIAVPGATNSPQVVNVSLTVTNPASLSAAPASLAFTFDGANPPAAQAITIASSAGALGYSVSTSGSFLSASPASGTTQGTVTVSVSAAGMAAGTYNGTVTITSGQAGNSPLSIPVTLTVQAILPAFSAALNAASLTPGIGAGGMILSIFGQRLGPDTGMGPVFDGGILLTSMGGVRVLVNGSPIPLLYVRSNQINAILPFSLPPTGTADVIVEYQGRRSAAFTMQLADAAPALFTADGSGSGLAAALNADGSQNSASNGAAGGSVIALFGTGGGQFDRAVNDGAQVAAVQPYPKLALPVTAAIGGREAVVDYAGVAPGAVAGAMQINLVVPTGLAPGRYPVTVKIGRYSTQLGVTIAVR